jgi:mannose-6-phosphate isomerase-like protein (cupin superfamily)
MSGFEASGDAIGASVSVIVVDSEPGAGPRLHRHPYEEVFVVLEGEATFTLGDQQRVVGGGEIVVAPAGVPHRFVNSGAGRLRQVDIHPRPRFETEWLE